MDKLKEGVSVKEIENFARRYMTEGFLIFSIIVATLSSIFDFFTGAGWSILFTGLGIVISTAFPEHVLKILKPLNQFIKKQEKTTQIIVGVVRLIFAIFIPFILFAEAGLLAGLSCHKFPHENGSSPEAPKKEKKPEENDEEHL